MTKNLELLFSDNFFVANPAKVMGEPYTTSGRFGPVTKYRGTIDDVLRIAAPDYTVADMLSPWVSSEHTPVTPSAIHKAEKSNIQRALEAAKEAVETPQQELWSFDDIDAQYNAHISHDDKVAFVWYMQSLGRSMSGGWRKYWIEEGDELSTLQRLAESGALLYDGNTKQKLVPGVVYFSGNIYEKRAQLEKDRELIIEQYGEKAYTAQQEKVDDFFRQVYDRRLTIDHPDPSKRLKILPTSRLASDFKIKSLNSSE